MTSSWQVLTSETFESHENCTRHQEAEVVGRPLLSRQRSSKLSLPLKAAQPAGPTEGDARDVGGPPPSGRVEELSPWLTSQVPPGYR